MADRLHNKFSLRDFIEDYRKRLIKAIDKLEITESSSIEELANEYVELYNIEPVILGTPIPIETKESTRNRKNDWGESYVQSTFEIKVEIPFTGNKDLFYCSPSETQLIYFDNEYKIKSDSVSILIVLTSLEENEYNKYVNNFKANLSANLPKINAEIAPWNTALKGFVISLLEKRSGFVSKKLNFMEKIGLRVNPKSDEFITPSPVTKKSIPIPVSDTTVNTKYDTIPVLQNAVYDDLKEVIYNVGRAIERKPSIYSGKHEEDLRDVFLLFLETRYESTSGIGEAFNKGGKTDILLKFAKDGSNIFIAECKFWKGQKKLLDGIDQLLGYLTHRDSKAALMIFVDQKEFLTVVNTAKTEIENHPQFKSFIKITYDSSISYEFVLPDDTLKSIQLELMFFHFPK